MNSLVLNWTVQSGCSAVYRVDRVSHAILRYRAVRQHSATHACPRPVKAFLTLGRASQR